MSPVSLAHATGRAHLVPPGVDCRLFTPPESGTVRDRRVLYVGRVERTSRWKGLHVLVESLTRLRELVPGVGLDIVGDGDDVDHLRRRAAALGVADLISWHGRVSHRELPGHYRRAGVTVLPSLTESESFGMTLVEAMACGCPVVGSAVGGIPFVVRDGVDGLLVPPGDPAALAEALAAVLDRPAARGRPGIGRSRGGADALGLVAPAGADGPDAPGGRWPGSARGRTTMTRLAERLVEALRRAIPIPVLPLVVWARFWIAWSRPSVRADARRQMRFLLEVARPEADVEAAARAYVKRMIRRAEIRWHPELLTQQRVAGIEHLTTAYGLGRGVVLDYMHHGYYEGLSPSLARQGVRSHMLGLDHIFGDDAPGWLKQNVRINAAGGGTPVSIAIGSQGIADLLSQGLVVTITSDVPGQTPVTFVGRQLRGSFGAARIATSTDSPVVVATFEIDASGSLHPDPPPAPPGRLRLSPGPARRDARQARASGAVVAT